MDEEIIQGKHIDEFPEVQPSEGRVLSDEEIEVARGEGTLKWQADMERFWATDNAEYPEKEGDYIKKAIAHSQDSKTASIVRAECQERVERIFKKLDKIKRWDEYLAIKKQELGNG